MRDLIAELDTVLAERAADPSSADLPVLDVARAHAVTWCEIIEAANEAAGIPAFDLTAHGHRTPAGLDTPNLARRVTLKPDLARPRDLALAVVVLTTHRDTPADRSALLTALARMDGLAGHMAAAVRMRGIALMPAIDPHEALPPHLGFGPPVEFALPTAVGQRLEARCRVEGVLDLQGRPDFGLYAELAVTEVGGGAFSIAATKLVIGGDDADLAMLVKEIVRSQLLLTGCFEAAGAL